MFFSFSSLVNPCFCCHSYYIMHLSVSCGISHIIFHHTYIMLLFCTHICLLLHTLAILLAPNNILHRLYILFAPNSKWSPYKEPKVEILQLFISKNGNQIIFIFGSQYFIFDRKQTKSSCMAILDTLML